MRRLQFISKTAMIFGFVIGIILLRTSSADISEARIREMLMKPVEQNADELMALIRQKRFKDVETFMRYVDRRNLKTRDDFRYFRAILEEWFFASEVLEFSRTRPVPQDVLPLLDQWVEQYPESEIAYIIRGVFYIERAWEIRSRKWSRNVEQKNWVQFRSLHMLAKEDL